jgi:hypothetical protein
MNEDEISYSSADDEPMESAAQEAAPEKLKRVGDLEGRRVICSKTFVVIVLLASAGVVGYLTHWFLSNEETDDFETKFKFDAKDVLDLTSSHAHSLLNTVRVTSLTFTSYAKYANATFPNFTMPVRRRIF